MTKSKEEIYDELTAPFRRAFELLEAADRNFQLAKFGLKQLLEINTSDPPMDLYRKSYRIRSGLYPDVQIAAICNLENLKREIHRDIENDFPQLSSSFATALWTIFEVFSKDLAIFWVQAFPHKVTLKKPKAAVEVLLDELVNIAHARDRLAWTICGRIMKDTNHDSDIRRYEYLFNVLGLSSPEFTESLINKLIELEAVRHLIVHKSAIVDQKFKMRCKNKKECPETIGEVFLVSDKRIRSYRDAIQSYMEVMANKVRAAAPGSVNF
jgi:hypothetical protein